MKKTLILFFLAFSLVSTSARAQSLKPDAPAPLQSGVNRGTVDSIIGSHYWYFQGEPGKTQVHATFKSMGLFGNAQRTSINVTMSDAANTWHTTKVLTSEGKPVDCTFDGVLKTPTKIIVSVAPPSNALVRAGGDYEIEATGTVAFGQKSTADPIVGTYQQMSGYTANLGACKFTSEGKIVTTSGASGDWKLFDDSTHMYVINVDGQERHSLRYVPARGLVDEGGGIVFQLVR